MTTIERLKSRVQHDGLLRHLMVLAANRGVQVEALLDTLDLGSLRAAIESLSTLVPEENLLGRLAAEAVRQDVGVEDLVVRYLREAMDLPPKGPKGRAFEGDDDDSLIRRLIAGSEPDGEALELARARPDFFGAFIGYILPSVASAPADNQRLLEVAGRIAVSPCDLALVVSLHGFGYRLLGSPERELTQLEKAACLAGDCTSCRADRKKRRSRAYAVLGMATRALAEADKAIELYQVLERQPGHHDVIGDGLVEAYFARADVRHHLGLESGDQELLSGAVEDSGVALDLLDPNKSPRLHRIAVFNLCVMLYDTGRPEDLERADEHLTTARRLFRGCERRTSERGRLVWATAMVRYALRAHRPPGRRTRLNRLRSMLGEALDTFLYLGMPFEASAVAADDMRIHYPDEVRIGQLVEKVHDRLKSRLRQMQCYQPESWAKLGDVGPLYEALDAVRSAARFAPSLGREVLRDTIEDLRKACGPGMLTCLIRWKA